MMTTLVALALVCLLSLAYMLIIPYFASTGLLMRFLPQDIREAAKAHSDPPVGRRRFGYLLTALALAGYIGVLCFLGADGLRRGYGFWLLFGRYMLFMYGYKLFDILVQDQMLVISGKYFVKFYPETRDCRSWDDRSFNTKNQLIRLFAFPFVCALMAWFTLLIGK